MSNGMSRQSTLRHMAPRILMVAGIGTIGLGAAAEILVPGSPLMARFGLSGTVFGLAAKMGGALFFGGLFAMAAAVGRVVAPPASSATPTTEGTVTAAALRAARIARERRAQPQA